VGRRFQTDPARAVYLRGALPGLTITADRRNRTRPSFMLALRLQAIRAFGGLRVAGIVTLSTPAACAPLGGQWHMSTLSNLLRGADAVAARKRVRASLESRYRAARRSRIASASSAISFRQTRGPEGLLHSPRYSGRPARRRRIGECLKGCRAAAAGQSDAPE